MVDNPGLILFYVTKFLQENVYFHLPTDTWVIAQEENGMGFVCHYGSQLEKVSDFSLQ